MFLDHRKFTRLFKQCEGLNYYLCNNIQNKTNKVHFKMRLSDRSKTFTIENLLRSDKSPSVVPFDSDSDHHQHTGHHRNSSQTIVLESDLNSIHNYLQCAEQHQQHQSRLNWLRVHHSQYLFSGLTGNYSGTRRDSSQKLELRGNTMLGTCELPVQTCSLGIVGSFHCAF